MRETSYGPSPNAVSEQTEAPSPNAVSQQTETPPFHLPETNEVTYTAGGNDLCPRGVFKGVVKDASREPHPTEAHEIVVTMIEVETQIGKYDLRMRVSLKTGWPLQKLRLHSGETVESLRAEIKDGGKQVTFDLSTLIGRMVVVHVSDSEYEGHKFTRIDTVDPESIRS
jgi:hypothetical protein